MISVEEAIEEISKMILEHQYHIYDDEGKIMPMYEYLVVPLEALQIAKAALEEKIGG